MAYEEVDCVDAGTDYCPCYLAETNNCLICSQLQGKLFCDCVNWKGVCIYQEYVWNGYGRKESREVCKANVLEFREIDEKIVFMKLKVSKTIARELNQPGSYILIRGENYPEFFNTPMSILYADEINGTIEFLIQIKGVKTKVLMNKSDSVLIKGPYWNGILGLKNLKRVKDSNCLIIARGVAQAPAVLVAKKLRASDNHVYVIADPGRINTDISEDYFLKLGCIVIKKNLLENRSINERTSNYIKEMIQEKDIKLVFTAGPDILHRGMIKMIKPINDGMLFSCTNNSTMCCGEGVCGGCTNRLKDGRKVKMCKAQLDPLDIYGR